MEKHYESGATRCTERDFILQDSFDECWRTFDTVLLDGFGPRAQLNLPPTETRFFWPYYLFLRHV